MTLLAPLGLLALLALPIIILLHLRRERLRRVVIPSLLLWQQIPQITGKRRKWLLPFSLLLLLHLVVAALLGLALAQPQWLGGLFATSPTRLAIIIDTTTSMQAQEQIGTNRMDLARAEARELINALGPSDRAVLVSLGPAPSLLASGTAGDRAQLLLALDRVQPSGTGANLADALTLARAALDGQGGSGPPRIVVISDLQPPVLAALPADQVEWVQVGQSVPNVAVVALTAQPRAGTGGFDVYARIANYAEQPTTVSVLLFGDEQAIDNRPLQLPANGESELTWTVGADITVLRAEVDLRDALTTDNLAYLSLTGTRPTQILLVSDTPARLQRALAVLPNVQVTVVDVGAYTSSPLARTADLTIFQNAMPPVLPSGGVLIINPPPTGSATVPFTVFDYTEPTSAQLNLLPRVPAGVVDKLDAVSLESVEFGRLAQLDVPPWLEPRLVRGTEPIILRGYTGTSEVAVWTFDLERSTLPSKIAFPVLIALTVRDLLPAAPPTAVPLGHALEMRATPRTTTVELIAPDGRQQLLTAAPTVLSEPLFTPGIYTLRELAENQVVFEGQLAVNAGSPLESNLAPRPMPVVETPYLATVQGTGAASDAATEPQPFWFIFVGIALAVLLFEWLYVHFRT